YRQEKRGNRGLESWRNLPWMIGRQIQQRQVFQLLFPVRKFLLHRRRLPLLTLPDGVITVLNAELGQNWLHAARVGFINQTQLVRDEADRLIVDDRMVRRHQHHMLVVLYPQ